MSVFLKISQLRNRLRRKPEYRSEPLDATSTTAPVLSYEMCRFHLSAFPNHSMQRTRRLSRANDAPGSAYIASPLAKPVAAPTLTRPTGLAPFPDSATPKRESSSLVWHQEHTVPTAPVAPSPETAQAISCTRSCTRSASLRNLRPLTATTGSSSVTPGSPPSSAALRPATNQPPPRCALAPRILPLRSLRSLAFVSSFVSERSLGTATWLIS